MRKLTTNQKLTIFCMMYAIVLSLVPFENANAQMIDATINRGADYIIRRLGPALFLFGIAIAGSAIATGNLDWVKRGAYVFIGGIIVMAAHPIFNAVASWAR